MASNEGLKPVSNDQVPIDPNVRIPDHVKRAAEAAEAFYKVAAPDNPDAATDEAARSEAARVSAEAAAAAALQPLPQEQVQNPQQVEPVPAANEGPGNISAEDWHHRFLSMQGRYNKATQTIGGMEQQMSELAQELVRTQNQLAAAQQTQPVNHGTSQPSNNNLITDEDRANYGDELIDLARRAAMSSVAPELDRLREDNQRLTNRVQSTSKRELFTTLDGRLPQWREINKDVRFKSWLRLPNVYTGQLRSEMLKVAVDGANAPQVLQLFKDFLTEAQATGQMAPAQQQEQQVQPVPRQAAVALETLAAPGRARPASGDSQVPTEKPIYSRAQITQLYRDKQRGLYAGREADFAANERELEAAQREGRIRG